MNDNGHMEICAVPVINTVNLPRPHDSAHSHARSHHELVALNADDRYCACIEGRDKKPVVLGFIS